MIEPLLMTTLRVITFNGNRGLTNATGFLFERESRLFLVTSAHVVLDEKTDHRPDRLEIEFHTNASDLAEVRGFSIPLYQAGRGVWRSARDDGGDIDVATIALDRTALPETATYQAFRPEHLPGDGERIEIGETLLAIGYPMGFQDELHRLPVARQAGLAATYGLRFQGHGYFLTDARTHRGISGAPVVMRDRSGRGGDLPWRLLGIHSSRLESGARDPAIDEALNLNVVWYSDVLMLLTGS